MKIVVAGTGFSSILCIKELVEKGIKPLVLDVGNEPDKNSKISLTKKILARQKNIDQFHLIGGLSNVWSGVLEEYNEKDLANWPIKKKDFENYYLEVFNNLSEHSKVSFSSLSYKELIDYKLSTFPRYMKRNIYNNKNISIKYSNILTKDLPFTKKDSNIYNNYSPYDLKKIIKDYIKNSEIEYKNQKILKISQTNEQVIIETLNKLNIKDNIICDYLFMGCGPISTYKIFKKSLPKLNKELRIKSTQSFVLPVKFNKMKNFKEKFYNKFPVFQINENLNDNYSIYSQVSHVNPILVNYFFPKIKNFSSYYNFLKIFSNYGYSWFVLGSDYCDSFYYDDTNNICLEKNKYNISEVLEKLNVLFDKDLFDGQFFHYNFPIKMKSLSGNYYGSIFPMSDQKKNYSSSDRFGRVANFSKVSVTDASIFTNLSARPPTLTILANSLRIVKEVLKTNFFK